MIRSDSFGFLSKNFNFGFDWVEKVVSKSDRFEFDVVCRIQNKIN